MTALAPSGDRPTEVSSTGIRAQLEELLGDSLRVEGGAATGPCVITRNRFGGIEVRAAVPLDREPPTSPALFVVLEDGVVCETDPEHISPSEVLESFRPNTAA